MMNKRNLLAIMAGMVVSNLPATALYTSAQQASVSSQQASVPAPQASVPAPLASVPSPLASVPSPQASAAVERHDWNAAGDDVKICLGNIGDVARVWVNGKPYGYAWTSPYEVTVPKRALRNGKNELRIVVANT